MNDDDIRLQKTGTDSQIWSGRNVPMTERNRIWRSRVKILDGSSRKKLLSSPAMAWGSQYSSVRSRSTSPSFHMVSQSF